MIEGFKWLLNKSTVICPAEVMVTLTVPAQATGGDPGIVPVQGTATDTSSCKIAGFPPILVVPVGDIVQIAGVPGGGVTIVNPAGVSGTCTSNGPEYAKLPPTFNVAPGGVIITGCPAVGTEGPPSIVTVTTQPEFAISFPISLTQSSKLIF
jgi:hypothetical protein